MSETYVKVAGVLKILSEETTKDINGVVVVIQRFETETDYAAEKAHHESVIANYQSMIVATQGKLAELEAANIS